MSLSDLAKALSGPCGLCGELGTPQNKVALMQSGGVVHTACVQMVEEAEVCFYCEGEFGDERILIEDGEDGKIVAHASCANF